MTRAREWGQVCSGRWCVPDGTGVGTAGDVHASVLRHGDLEKLGVKGCPPRSGDLHHTYVNVGTPSWGPDLRSPPIGTQESFFCPSGLAPSLWRSGSGLARHAKVVNTPTMVTRPICLTTRNPPGQSPASCFLLPIERRARTELIISWPSSARLPSLLRLT